MTSQSLRKIIWIGVICFAVIICVSSIIQNTSIKLEGAWEINEGEEYIVFYDNGIAVCDGDEIVYRILDRNTLTLDGEVFEFEIIDKRNKKMILDEKN